MTPTAHILAASAFALVHVVSLAAQPDFSGHWVIDLRTPQERQKKRDCGMATFTLEQHGDRIVGNHTFSTVSCGRLNEGGEGTVQGIVAGGVAVLTVKSGRNDAIVLGKAIRQGRRLNWTSIQEIAPGNPEDDASLILGRGTLVLQDGARQ